MADSISSTDDALMRYNAENFLNLAKHITQQSEFIKQFDRLTPIVQEHVVLELCNHDNKRLLDLLPYKKYEVGYNKVIKDNIERSPGLIKEILNTYYEDMQEFLVSLFQGAMSENSCIVVAEVLAKTALGLGVLDMAIQKGDFLHQVCAIKGVNKIIDVKSVQPELLDVIKKYRTHENYLIRLECIFGLNKTNNLTIDYLSAALQDENSNIRYRTIHLIKK